MKELPPATDGTAPSRIYAIGDVHGHADRLDALHDAIRQDFRREPPESALLIHLGDYIDRGPDSARCLSILMAGSPVDGVPAINLMGNHERMMLDALGSAARAELWLHNGGAATLASFGVGPDEPWAEWHARVPQAELAFLRGLRSRFTAGRFVFAHAGVRPGIRLERQSEEDLLWIRGDFLQWPGVMLPDMPGKLIVHGHTPSTQPEIQRNRIGIDTNAARGGKLTCAVLSSESVYFLQV